MSSKLRFLVVSGVMMALTISAHAQQAAQGTKGGSQAAPADRPMTTSRQALRPPAQGKAEAQPVAPAKGSPPVSTAKTDPSAQLTKAARLAGFEPHTRHGVTLYCKSEVELGSAFPVKTCYDAIQMKIKLGQYQTERDQLRQARGLNPQGH